MSSADVRTTARRVAVTIGLLVATLLLLGLIYATRRVLGWIVVAAFFAVALHPAVGWTERRLVRHRTVATLLVFLAALAVLTALLALIVVPLTDEVARFVDQAPHWLRQARQGQGPIGALLERTGLRRYVDTHHEQLQQYGSRLSRPTVDLLRSVVAGLAGVVTVTVLAFLMVLQAPRLIAGTLRLLDERRAERLRRVGPECARVITGYLSGNLLISVICGLATFAVLVVLGVPFAGVIALLVALTDLIPLVGATLGAIIAVGSALLHSPSAGLVVLVFFVLYQQLENHLLQPLIMSRTVRLNPLTVLVSVLLAADLAGLLGALLAIPVAGIVQILLREAAVTRRLATAARPAAAAASDDDPSSPPST